PTLFRSRHPGVVTGEGEAQARVPRLVHHCGIGRFDQVCGRAEREKLERKARERRDRGVLHERDARKVIGQGLACRGRQASDSWFWHSRAPILPVSQGRRAFALLNQERAPARARCNAAPSLASGFAMLRWVAIVPRGALVAGRLAGELERTAEAGVSWHVVPDAQRAPAAICVRGAAVDRWPTSSNGITTDADEARRTV